MIKLLNIAPTVALAAQIGDLTGPQTGYERVRNSLVLQANFTYGSGGTTLDAWVQTSLDGGVTWIDICQFSFATTSLIKVANLSARTAVAQFTPTDGSMAANTLKDGILGDRLRVKWTSVGVYAGTTLLITAVPD